MAKAQGKPINAPQSAFAREPVQASPIAPVQESPVRPSSPARWSVTLTCPTPLAHPTLEVEASCEAEAKQKFFDANGISGSEHSLTITRI